MYDRDNSSGQWIAQWSVEIFFVTIKLHKWVENSYFEVETADPNKLILCSQLKKQRHFFMQSLHLQNQNIFVAMSSQSSRCFGLWSRDFV